MGMFKLWMYSVTHRFRYWGVAVSFGVFLFLIYANANSIIFNQIPYTAPTPHLAQEPNISSKSTSTVAESLMKHIPVSPGTTAPTDCRKLKGDARTACWIGAENLSKDGEYYKTLKAKAGKDNAIFLASVDSSFVDMAYNMYETSFKKFKITNFLYVCSDAKAVDTLKQHGIDCFLYKQETENERATEYGSKAFILKMRVKMKMITAALMLGFTAVLTDLDVVFFRDPLPELLAYKADLVIMSDVSMDNCGFYLVRANTAGVELQKQTLEICMTRIIADQDAIAQVIKTMTKKKTLKKLTLDKQKFACGLVYYENGKRMFVEDNPCDEKCATAVVHNNWIVSKAGKIFRFKETGQWMYDPDGYYSNPQTKYLMYQNPLDLGKQGKEKEKAAMIAALTLGRILNRTVIMPRFHCYGCSYGACKIAHDHCAFNTHFHVRTFDGQFQNAYRENSFLASPLVPSSVKSSISNEILIKTAEHKDSLKPSSEKSVVFNASSWSDGSVTESDVIHWFATPQYQELSVLKFHSLYLKVSGQNKEWNDKIKAAIRYSDYRQYKAK